MRLGFLLGFLVGAAVASLLARAERVEAPTAAEPEAEEREPPPPEAGARERVQRKLQEALTSAREAAAEKERAMRRDFETAIGRG